MENKDIEKAAQQYAHEYCDMLDLSHYKGLQQGFIAGARLKIVQLNQLESELTQLKAENERLKWLSRACLILIVVLWMGNLEL